MHKLSKHIESLIFVAEKSISIDELKEILDGYFNTKFQIQDIETTVVALQSKYYSEDFAIEIVQIAGGYKFMSKAAYQATIGHYLKQNSKKKLSKAALEVLAIVAYKQPVPKSEVEHIRGVNCDYSMQKLLEKDLLEITGRDSGPGRPLLYGTSQKFMDYFDLGSMEDLPKPKEFKTADFIAGPSDPIEHELLPKSTEEE